MANAWPCASVHPFVAVLGVGVGDVPTTPGVVVGVEPVSAVGTELGVPWMPFTLTGLMGAVPPDAAAVTDPFADTGIARMAALIACISGGIGLGTTLAGTYILTGPVGRDVSVGAIGVDITSDR